MWQSGATATLFCVVVLYYCASIVHGNNIGTFLASKEQFLQTQWEDAIDERTKFKDPFEATFQLYQSILSNTTIKEFENFIKQFVTFDSSTQQMYTNSVECPFDSKSVEYRTDSCCDFKQFDTKYCFPRNVTLLKRPLVTNVNTSLLQTSCNALSQNTTNQIASLIVDYWNRLKNVNEHKCRSKLFFQRRELLLIQEHILQCYNQLFITGTPCSRSDDKCYTPGGCDVANGYCPLASRLTQQNDTSFSACILDRSPIFVQHLLKNELQLVTNASLNEFHQALVSHISNEVCINEREVVLQEYTNKTVCEAFESCRVHFTSNSSSNCKPMNSYCSECIAPTICNIVPNANANNCTLYGRCETIYKYQFTTEEQCADYFCNNNIACKNTSCDADTCHREYCVGFPMDDLADMCVYDSVYDDQGIPFPCDLYASNAYLTSLGCVSRINNDFLNTSRSECIRNGGTVYSPPNNSQECLAFQSCLLNKSIWTQSPASVCALRGGEFKSVFRWLPGEYYPSFFNRTTIQMVNDDVVKPHQWKRILDQQKFETFISKALLRGFIYPYYRSYLDCSLNPILETFSSIDILCTSSQTNEELKFISVGSVHAIPNTVQQFRFDDNFVTLQANSVNSSTSRPFSSTNQTNSISIQFSVSELNYEQFDDAGVILQKTALPIYDDSLDVVVGEAVGQAIQVKSTLLLNNVQICIKQKVISSQPQLFAIPMFGMITKKSKNQKWMVNRNQLFVAQPMNNVYSDVYCASISATNSNQNRFMLVMMKQQPQQPTVVSIASTISLFSFLLLLIGA